MVSFGHEGQPDPTKSALQESADSRRRYAAQIITDPSTSPEDAMKEVQQAQWLEQLADKIRT